MITQNPILGDVTVASTPTVVAIPADGAANHPDNHVDTNDTVAANRATEQVIDAVSQDRQCTLTIGEAQDMFRRLLRRPLSERSLQRYCSTGVILAQLISHSQGKEWLLNETSLIRFIERYPITLSEAPQPTVTPVASPPSSQPPHFSEKITPTAPPLSPDNGVIPAATADNMPDSHIPTSDTVATNRTTAPTNIRHGSATTADMDDFPELAATGERRRLGDVLIENARLSAIIEGKEEVIETLKTHDTHMRTELRESKSLISKLSGDVSRIASQMLQTMQAIGTAGKSLSAPPSPRGAEESDDVRE